MSKPSKKAKRERHERRFLPHATTSPLLVYAVGVVGALALGAGSWAQWGRIVFGGAEGSLPFGWWVLAGGAVLTGLAIWFGTSGEPLLRVGDGGIVVEKGGFFGTLPPRRMPWHALESLAYEGESGAVVARGRDDAGLELVLRARIASHPQAVAWMVREARARVPAAVQLGDEVALPEAREDAGEPLVLDPVQVVGKRCAASGTILAFEPDARVCPRCERVYHKDHVPAECACGGSLAPQKGETARSGVTGESEASQVNA
jgi:hypothetical protein